MTFNLCVLGFRRGPVAGREQSLVTYRGDKRSGKRFETPARKSKEPKLKGKQKGCPHP
jgi:hypothetical protein